MFFYQSLETLIKKQNLMVSLLEDFNFAKHEIDDFVKSYNYFIANPSNFDGATIVADIYFINKLDVCAMLHDWQYLTKAMDFNSKLKHDWRYCQNMRKIKVNWFTAYSRYIGLLILTPLYYASRRR